MTRRRPAGFTLVELMVVVAIVGILATIAYVSFRKLTKASKVGEAQQNVQAIGLAQEAYKAETGTYYLAFASGTWCPAAVGSPGTPQATPVKASWDSTCGGTGTDWSPLSVRIVGNVQYAYTMYTSGGTAFPTSIPNCSIALTSTPASQWYIALAAGDTDSDTQFTYVAKASFQSALASCEND